MARHDTSHSYQTADNLHSVAIRLFRRLRRFDDFSGLSAPKLSALSVIVFAKSCSVGQLAKAEQVRPATASQLVRQLESEGLLRRKSGQQDRRIVYLEATPKGRRLLQQGRQRRLRHLAKWISCLPAEDVNCLARAAGIMGEMIEFPTTKSAKRSI